jgi:hypothetical protein
VKAQVISQKSGGNSRKRIIRISVLSLAGVMVFSFIVLNTFPGKRTNPIDESLAKSIAVLPFHNLSGDEEQE